MKICYNKLSMNLQLLASEENKEKTIDEQILTLQEKILNLENVQAENEQLRKQNELLFNKNQEYFLKITGNTPTENNDEENEYKEFVGEEFYNSLSNKEKKLLHTILEGEDE